MLACLAIGISGCDRRVSAPQDALGRQPTHAPRPTVADVPVARWRGQLQEAYRLRPDFRFLLAFGEVGRLAAGAEGPPREPAQAVFEDGHWRLTWAGREVGRLPELPNFPDYLALLVAQAGDIALETGGGAETGAGKDFLMPGLATTLESVNAEWGHSPARANGARAFARLAFQLPDRRDVAPLLTARALALLAAVRARDPRAGLEEEVLLAHVLGYTRHAETAARSLPPGSAVRLFESGDAGALRSAAAAPSASEETRFLALVRAADTGDLAEWKEARAQLFPGNTSAAVIGTGLALGLPRQVEVEGTHWKVADAVTAAVVREMAEPTFVPASTDSPEEFDQRLSAAMAAKKGSLWDGAALRAYYEGGFYSVLDLESWNEWPRTGTGLRLWKLVEGKAPPDPGERPAGIGGPLLIQQVKRRLEKAGSDEASAGAEIRKLVPAIDSRPSSQAELAQLQSDYLQDPLAAERLHRSLLEVVGEGASKQRATSALYLGDWDTMKRTVRSPAITPTEATFVLWAWYVSRAEPDALEAEYARLVERFPFQWDVASSYVDVLRDHRKFAMATAVGEKWLARNTGPRTPGQFHAHIRLAHSYVLAGQYAKGLALLQGMQESERFQKAMIDRGIAECFMGLGRLPEAEKRIQAAFAVTPEEPEVVRELAMLFWLQGRWDEAAKTLAKASHSMSGWDFHEALTTDLARAFVDQPVDRLNAAVAALARQDALRRYATWMPGGFVAADRPDLAFQVSSGFTGSPNGDMDLLIASYGYLKKWKGREASVEWLKARVPPQKRNPLSMKAFYAGHDDLLWDLIGTPDAADHPEWVWLFRAYALALRPEENGAHRGALLDYYRREDPDRDHQIGRFVVGLADESAIGTLATDVRLRAEIAYALGARAESEGRIRDACEWYRVAVETQSNSISRTLAIYRLRSWSGSRQGIWKVERDRAVTRVASASPAR